MMDKEDTNRHNEEPKDPYFTTRIPLTDLAVYLEQIEALPSIEENFLRIPLTEEERKEPIHSFPRSSLMKYLLPPLSDSDSAAVKKADTILHRIQVALAEATCPINFYVYHRIQENPQVNYDDPHILFTSTMRVLFSDIASTVTEGRLDNLNKSTELARKSHQLVELDTKPLMNQENLDALIARKRPKKRYRIHKLFRGRRQYGTQYGTSSKPDQKLTAEAAPQTIFHDLELIMRKIM
ncbi:hypothetical protein AYI70_g6525 [Smittium culicis]|uniref:Uncharacterized protein n=1 Tax=Smittium culicis TaxID=133412 RepID=A0A1R1XPP1_9FUNG|nr:hypothetical protein AYI70_g6525 [Smittium culicis]